MGNKKITSFSELNVALMNECKIFTEMIADDVKQLVEDFIMVYYSEFTPSQYERTFSFINSVTRTSVIKEGNVYKVYIYLDPSGIDYEELEPIDVWELANIGSHGGVTLRNDNYSDNHFWDDTIALLESGYIVAKFAGFMKSKGYSIRVV